MELARQGRRAARSLPPMGLGEDQEAIGIPVERLDPIPASIPENEQVTGQGGLPGGHSTRGATDR